MNKGEKIKTKEENKIANWFGENLAVLLNEKILQVFPSFENKNYQETILEQVTNLTYKQRVELHADILNSTLPGSYQDKIRILIQIMGKENPNETGMFKDFYWLLPVSKFIEKYGLEYFDISINAIEELTKRCTGEFAIRPFINLYPEKSLKVMKNWSLSKNFHLRRLSSEGLRPKLPWAKKLEIFIENPKPVFDILNKLMNEEVKFVAKSVANNIADYLKVNRSEADKFISKWSESNNKNTAWIIKHACRNIK